VLALLFGLFFFDYPPSLRYGATGDYDYEQEHAVGDKALARLHLLSTIFYLRPLLGW
jgi:hypothetical protein